MRRATTGSCRIFFWGNSRNELARLRGSAKRRDQPHVGPLFRASKFAIPPRRLGQAACDSAGLASLSADYYKGRSGNAGIGIRRVVSIWGRME